MNSSTPKTKDQTPTVHSKFTATSKHELLDYLSKQDITVPDRIDGRKSEHCERWAGFRFLATWATADLLSYPLYVIHRNKPDRPDFLILSDSWEIGVECTEAVPQEWAETDAQASHMEVSGLLPMDSFKLSTPKRTYDERRELILNPHLGCGFAGGEPEQEWMEWMMIAIHKKTIAFNKPEFKKCDINRLLIYDNACLPNANTSTAAALLAVKLGEYWKESSRYDCIAIDDGNHLVRLCPAGWNIQPITDLWTK